MANRSSYLAAQYGLTTEGCALAHPFYCFYGSPQIE